MTGNRLFLANIDECDLSTNVCSPHLACQNTVGSYSCTCNPGYSQQDHDSPCVGKSVVSYNNLTWCPLSGASVFPYSGLGCWSLQVLSQLRRKITYKLLWTKSMAVDTAACEGGRRCRIYVFMVTKFSCLFVNLALVCISN